MNSYSVLASLYKLASAQYWVQRREGLIQSHRDGWFLSLPSFLFMTEQKNNWSSGSLYLKQQKCMYICKAWQMKVVRGPQLGNSYPYRQREDCHDFLMDGSIPVRMFWRCYLTCDTNSEFEGKTYLRCLHNTSALPAPQKSHTFLKLFPAYSQYLS